MPNRDASTVDGPVLYPAEPRGPEAGQRRPDPWSHTSGGTKLYNCPTSPRRTRRPLCAGAPVIARSAVPAQHAEVAAVLTAALVALRPLEVGADGLRVGAVIILPVRRVALDEPV